jgi:two-component system sensor histidine kinase AlgZ
MFDVPISSPLHTLWRAPVLLWVLLIAEGLAAILALAPGLGGDRLIYFGLTSLLAQWIALLTLAMLYLLRASLARLRPQRLAYVALALLLLCTALIAASVWLLLHSSLSITQDDWKSLLLRLAGVILIVGLLGLGAFQNYWHAQRSAVRAKQAELEALQARVHPHFLFNTLNSAAALVHVRPDEAESVLLDMADLFRAALAAPGWVPLQHELELTRRYLRIEQLRFADRLHVEWDVAGVEGDRSLHVPLLSIQPLVENAIVHGVELRREPSTITIVIAANAAGLDITIRNPSPGAPEPALSRAGHNIGLAAVRARVYAACGREDGVKTAFDNGEFVAAIHLPRAVMPKAQAADPAFG